MKPGCVVFLSDAVKIVLTDKCNLLFVPFIKNVYEGSRAF